MTHQLNRPGLLAINITLFLSVLTYFFYFIKSFVLVDIDTINVLTRLDEGEIYLYSPSMLAPWFIKVFTDLYFFVSGIWDPFFGAAMLYSLSSAVIIVIVFNLLYSLTRKLILSIFGTMLILFNFGFWYLTTVMENNILNMVFDCLFIFFLIKYIKLPETSNKKKKLVYEILMGISLGFAICTHLSSVLQGFLVFLILFKKGISGRYKC